jgi:NitT/TauT family transport system ATP-binding protein
VLFVTHSITEAVYLSDRIVVMSPRPGKVLRVIDVDLARPRDATTLSNPSFSDISTELRQIFIQMGIA